MKIAVASGKGGTGKTTVAVGLALAATGNVRIIDADVESPNVHVYLEPDIDSVETATIPVPEVDESKCTRCGACSQYCEYHAIAVFPDRVVVMPELCHGCGACLLECPTGAISEIDRPIGTISHGTRGTVTYVGGESKVGEAIVTPIVRALRSREETEPLTIIDGPPGVACPAVASIRGSDYVLLVAEPTEFGFHDLKLAVDMVRRLGIPFGIVVNRSDGHSDVIRRWCDDSRIPVLLELPERREIAEASSRGVPITELDGGYEHTFRSLLRTVLDGGNGGDEMNPTAAKRSNQESAVADEEQTGGDHA